MSQNGYHQKVETTNSDEDASEFDASDEDARGGERRNP
jgi:hypothetical protein